MIVLPQNEYIISGSWNSKTFKLITTLRGHSEFVLALNYLSSEIILSASVDQTIKLWNVTSFKLISTLYGHTGVINALAVLPSTKLIVSGSYDRIIKLWNITFNKQIKIKK